MFDTFVCIPPVFRAAIYNGDAVLLLSQMLKKQGRHGVEFTFPRDDIKAQTGLGFDAQRTARALLCELGVLSERRGGIPYVLYYTVNLDALAKLLEPHGVTPTDIKGLCHD